MKSRHLNFAAGLLIGAVLCGSGTAMAAGAISAVRSTQPIYLDGQQITLEAYEINGNNYVKLRDVGQALDFNVYWDGAVQIESDKAYTGTAPASQTTAPVSTPAASQTPDSYTISVDHWSREDFSQQANPAVFTGVYDRNLYNTIRQTLEDGTSENPAYTMVAKGDDYSAVKNLVERLDSIVRYEHYVPENFVNYWQYLDYFAVSAEIPESYQAPLAFIQSAIKDANKLNSDREKVEYLNDYLCTLLAYEKGNAPGITRIFAPHTGELKAACSSYARAFKFLCQAADIPCITISTAIHTWDLVYVDGQWLHVDVAANDLYNNHNVLLTETYPNHTDQAPEATAFLKELLVPGSTK